MIRCDACGIPIDERDFLNGAVKSIQDQPETDNLCIKCNKENEDE